MGSLARRCGRAEPVHQTVAECSDQGLADVLAESCRALPISAEQVRARLSAYDLAQWRAGELSAAELTAFAAALADERQRRAGAVPARYTDTGVCPGCGPVFLPPGWPRPVTGCPWCYNRLEALPIPRPQKHTRPPPGGG